MRGTGGPLLCIGDLLSDVGEHEPESISHTPSPSSPSSSLFNDSRQLPKLFQESYGQLNQALASGDQSWTALTLKLCSALDAANQLVQSTNENSRILQEEVRELEKIVKRCDSAVGAAKSIQISSNSKGRLSSDGS